MSARAAGAPWGRGAHADLPLVVVGGPVRLAGRVHGDLVVFGDLFLRPGAQVDGRAIAVGGGVYGSTLAFVRGDVLPYRELAVAQSTTSNGASLAITAGPSRPVPFFSLPGVVGVRLPTYDRIDGLNLTAGPEIAFDTGRVRLEPFLTYRSHLGEIDPGVRPRRATAATLGPTSSVPFARPAAPALPLSCPTPTSRP